MVVIAILKIVNLYTILNMKKSFQFLIIFLFVATNTFSQAKKWTLEECVNYALKNNISVKLSEIDAKNSLISKNAAFGNFLPTINASGTHCPRR